jgi:hypothetical protein
MTVPYLTQGDFIQLIKDGGWEILNSTFWEDNNRLIFELDSIIFTFQCKNKYFYLEVVETCKILKIAPPEDHLHAYYRHMRLDEEDCYCPNGQRDHIKFKDCHGKID